MKNTKLLCALLALCVLPFALIACNSKNESQIEESGTIPPIQQEVVTPIEGAPVVQMPNPVVEFDTVEDAVIHVGHLSTTPDIYAKYNQRASVINDSLIQIVFSDDSGDILTLREEAGTSEDISGNYNEYEYTSTFDVDGNQITVKGDSEDSIKLAIWNDGAYAHSLSYENGVTLEEVTNAVKGIK